MQGNGYKHIYASLFILGKRAGDEPRFFGTFFAFSPFFPQRKKLVESACGNPVETVDNLRTNRERSGKSDIFPGNDCGYPCGECGYHHESIHKLFAAMQPMHMLSMQDVFA